MSAVGRDEVADIIGHKATMSNEDPRIFYRAYTQRRNNANARKRDHYMQFIFEQNRERRKHVGE